MKYNFDLNVDRIGTQSLKWDFRKKMTGVEDILPLWVADMDFPAPQAVIEAVKKRAAHGIYGYSDKPESYYAAVAAWFDKRFQWKIDREWIVVTPGVVPAVNLAVQSFTQPGDGVIVQPPVYYPFMWAIENNGRRVKENPLCLKNGHYRMDLDHLEKIIDSRTRMLVLCSPHNPVGRVWSREELVAVGKICRKHDIVLLADEIHQDLIMPGHRHLPLASLDHSLTEISVTCTAPSKTFNLAGMQISNIVIQNKNLRDRFAATLFASGVGMSNPFGIVAAQAAYSHGEDWLEELIVYIHENYLFMRDYFAEHLPAVCAAPLQGTYLSWLDFRALGIPDSKLKTILRRQARVWLDEGPMFGTGGSGFARINLACPRQLLSRAVQGICSAFAD